MLQKTKRYLFKAAWRATALKFWVDAHSEDEAVKKAERTVIRMEGGTHCMDLQLLKSKEGS